MFASDQNPSSTKKTLWVPFFKSRNSSFNMEQKNMQLNLIVLFFVSNMIKLKERIL